MGQAQVVRLMRNHQMGHPEFPMWLLESAKSWILCFSSCLQCLVTIRNRKTTARARPAIIRLGVGSSFQSQIHLHFRHYQFRRALLDSRLEQCSRPSFSNSSSTGVTATYQSELLANTGKLSLELGKMQRQKCCLQE